MKPTSYKEIKSGVFEFFYNKDDYNNFHKNGKENGDVGFILKERDYLGKFTKYEGYGTIESPNKDLNYITIKYSKFFDDEFCQLEGWKMEVGSLKTGD